MLTSYKQQTQECVKYKTEKKENEVFQRQHLLMDESDVCRYFVAVW